MIGRGQPDLAELLLRSRSWADLLGDGVDDDGAVVVDEDGVALDQLEAVQFGERGGEPGGGGQVGAAEQRGAAELSRAPRSIARGVGGERDDATSSSTSA